MQSTMAAGWTTVGKGGGGKNALEILVPKLGTTAADTMLVWGGGEQWRAGGQGGLVVAGGIPHKQQAILAG